MELLSSIFENMLVADPTISPEEMNTDAIIHDAGKKQEAMAKLTETAKNLGEKDAEVLISPISSYWYLEDNTQRANHQLSDRIMEKLLSVVIVNEADGDLKILPIRKEMQKHRPAFSMSIMNTNSTQLAQKASPMFEGMDAIIMCMTWHNPFFTSAILLLGTHAILKPVLFLLFPALLVLVRFMFPSYLKLYPSDNTFVDGKFLERNPFPHPGKPLGTYELPKPAPMYSKEYLMNFTDMQNHIIPYIRLHDAVIEWGKHYFLFEDEKLSTLVFLTLVFIIAFNTCILPFFIPIILRIVPLKAMEMVALWTVFICCHPKIQNKLLDTLDTEEARLARLDMTDRLEKYLMSYIHDDAAEDFFCETEVYEIHRYNTKLKTWVPLGYTREMYSLNHPDRIHELGVEDDSTESLFDADTTIDEIVPDIPIVPSISKVRPPVGWKFVEGGWKIDLKPHKWVNDNCIMDLVCIDDDEKWVYDVLKHEGSSAVFRRRRWYRYSYRTALKKPAMNSESSLQQDL